MIIEIVSVGTELLLGDTLNTNAQFLSQQLAEIGADVYYIVTVGDNDDRLKEQLRESLNRSDMVITTGGLGSTNDDITKRIAIELANLGSTEDETSREFMRSYFNREDAMEANRIVYTFPKGAQVFHNPHGTAPGALIPMQDDKDLVIFPGPPNEMQPMFLNHLKPILEERTHSTTVSRVLKFALIGEWEMANRVDDLLRSSQNPTIAPYAKQDGAILRITARASSSAEADKMIDPVEALIRREFGDLVYSSDGTTREELLVHSLASRNEFVATAESITGGLVSAKIINVPGASNVLAQSFVTYSDDAKAEVLSVSRETLEAHTAVSEEVCLEMLIGLEAKTGADLCIATTGYAGPDGEDVGKVYIGVSYHGKREIHEKQYHAHRQRIRQRTVNNAIDYANLALKQAPSRSEQK